MGRMPVAPGTMWLRVVDGGERLCGVAVHTPSRCVLVSPMPADAVLLLAETLADEARSVGRLPGVDGPTEVATAFARGYTGLTSCSWTAGLDQRMLALHRVTPPRAAAGECLAATSRDVDLITAWMSAFTHEAISGQQPPTSGALAQRIDQQPPSIWLWTIDGQPTSLCWQSMPAAGVVRVSAVFTPKHQRGHGYASANVAAVSQRALDAGASACMLYTDRTNPTATASTRRSATSTSATRWNASSPRSFGSARPCARLTMIGRTRPKHRSRAGDWPGSAPADGSSPPARARHRRPSRRSRRAPARSRCPTDR